MPEDKVIEGKPEGGEKTDEKVQNLTKPDTSTEEQARTTAKKALFLRVFVELLGSVGATCKKVEITRMTFYEWKKNDPEFRKKLAECWEMKLEDVEEIYNLQLAKGNPSLLRHFLDRRHPEYRPHLKVITPGAGEKNAEDYFDDFFAEDNAENKQGHDNGSVSDQDQTGADGPVSAEPGASVLPKKADKAKYSFEGKA